MKSNKKIAIALLTCLISVSFISTVPINSSAATGDVFKSHIGHDFSESYWSVVYDTVGSKLEEDHNPGPYQGNLSEGLDDDIPNIDSKYYVAWNNLENVHSLYLAMQNFTWDVSNYNSSLYGCAPYQMFLQHFTLPNMANYHAFVLNKFLGLMAYRDIPGGLNGVPDENDSLYLGWTRYSEWHKYIVNTILDAFSIPEYYHIDDTKQGKATPIEMTYDSATGTYEFGMCYEDIFVLWQKIAVEEGLDQTVQHTELLHNCSAFGMFSSINFTFKIKSVPSSSNPGYNEITTTTEYDIGELDDLWIIGDNSTVADSFGGNSFNLNIPSPLDIDIGHYNSTNYGISKRLNGTSSVPGFGLAVINTANVKVIKLGLLPQLIAANLTGQGMDPLGSTFANLSQAQFSYQGTPAYSIDFASKPNYIWNGTETLNAPTRVLKNALMKTNISHLMDLQTRLTLATLIGQLTGSVWAGLLSLVPDFFGEQYFSLTCFPKWSGASISQDPTFIVFAPATDGGDDGGIPGFNIPVIALIGLCSASIIGYTIWKRKN